MPVKINTTEFGHSLPPEGPHTITLHFPGWETAMGFRDGDMSLFRQLKSMYPRFAAFGLTRELVMALHKALSLPATHGCLAWASPDTFAQVREFALSPSRGDDRLDESDLLFRVVDVSLAATATAATKTVRLYVVAAPQAKFKAVAATWQIAGTGVSTRLAEMLLRRIESTPSSMVEVAEQQQQQQQDSSAASSDNGSGNSDPLPQVDAHAALRSRICSLLRRAPIDADRAAMLRPEADVYLHPSGMAAIYRAHQALKEHRAGKVLALGAVFKTTWQMFVAGEGMKHFGRCDAASGLVARVEQWLEAEAAEGRQVSYCFVEFPSNPILVSADLVGMRRLADKYNFPLVVDDTVGSFSNIDLLPVADVIVTSLTKSFSGYADVMGGSIVLNPSFPASYALLAPIFARRFRNEFFEADATQLLSNSEDYMARSAVLNRNAAAVAKRLASLPPSSPAAVAQVNYPPYLDTGKNYDAFLRPATPDFTPGHGCLLSVDFVTVDRARAFYESSQFYQGPHLGAHLTLAVPFGVLAWHGKNDDGEYHEGYGLRAAQVRISVGLEAEAELLETLEDALVKGGIV